MKIHRLSLPLIIGVCLFIRSQTAYTLEILPDMTVTPSETSLERLVNNPQILEEDDLFIAHERSVTDVIQGLPGLNVSKNGYGQLSGVLMRGAGGQGLVTLDDVPLLASIPGLQNVETIPTEAIESTTIERGPGAAYHSFQTLGGAIRLYTQDREDTGSRLSLEGGSFGIVRETLQGGVSGTPGRVTLTLSRGDAFDGTHVASAADNPERDRFRFSQGILRFSTDLGSRLNWQGSVLYQKSWVGSDTLGLDKQNRVAYLDDKQGFNRDETWLAQNTLNAKITSNWNSSLQLAYTQLADIVKVQGFQSDRINRLYLANMRHQHTLVDNEAQHIRWQLNWGGQGRHERVQSSVFDEERTMATGFLETEAQYYNLSGQTGVRVEHFDRFGTHPLFKTAAAWQIMPELTLRASGGTGYRIPSYTELLDVFFGNPQLKPERSASGDLGVEWQPLKNLHLTVNAYYNRYDDLIATVYSPQRGPFTINVADAEVAGMELDAQYAWTDSLDTGVSYTVSNSRDLATGLLLPLRPPHIARVWGQQKLSGLPITLWAETIVRSAAWNDLANTIALNESVQVNASVRYAVTKQFEVYLRGENLTNNRTAPFYSIDTPGVAVYGGFQLDL